MVNQASIEHTRLVTKIKDMMDKKRATKTLTFKHKLIEKPQSSLRQLVLAKMTKNESTEIVDTNKVLQEHNHKDNLFFEK
jgi:hypothetical protein